jgi:hypothetical protein
MTKKDAMQFLADLGYYTDVLWSIEDVTDHYKCTDEQAYSILNDALTSEYVMEKISDKIYLIAEDLNLERK